jgi:hypothetical protein
MFVTFYLDRPVRFGPINIGLSFSPPRLLLIAEHCFCRCLILIVQNY